MKKRSVLYTWAIEFAILLALMTAMLHYADLFSKEKTAGRVH